MAGRIGGFLHLAIGEEAAIVGTVSALRADDPLTSTYREHGQALARGSDPRAVMAELLGRSTGLCGGRGGSMHLMDRTRSFFGGYGIVGGSVPLALGLAWASRYREQDHISVTMFGEGAANQGVASECFNMASLWKLPIVFLILNNQYGMGTPVVVDGHVVVRDVMTLSLSVDHRVIYGAEAATFLGWIAELLEHPAALLV